MTTRRASPLREVLASEAAGGVVLMAAAALALWLGGVACGKLLLYTNHILLTTD
jgi:Na+/H+ antiporter NhaA